MACVRKKYSRCNTTYSVSLHGPCIRHGETRKRMFPRSPVRFYDELSHSGFLDTLEYLDQGVDTDVDAWKVKDTDWYESDDEDDYNKEYTAKRDHTHALVVQPTTLEHAQWAMGPFKRIIEKLQELLDGSRGEALGLARRVLLTKRDWTPASFGREDVTDDGWNNNHHRFKQMMEVVLVLNDATVFCDLLRNVKCFEYEVENVPRGIQHFGWDSCITAIKSILDDPRSTFRSRVNLVCMALLNSSNTGHINLLMHKLAAVVPWSRPRAITENAAGLTYGTDPYTSELTRLFQLAFRSSPSTLLELVGEPPAVRVTIDCIVPALVAFANELSVADRSVLLPLLCSLRDTIDAAMEDDGPFALTVSIFHYTYAAHAPQLLSSLTD